MNSVQQVNGNLKKQNNQASTRAERLRQASQQRRSQEKREVREAILQAASELFLEHGYQNFSLRQVAERIGYSPGTIYLYFQDKDEILFTIMSEGIVHFTRLLNEATNVPDARERLTRLGRAYVDFGLGHPAHFQLMFMQRTDYLLRTDATTLQPVMAIFDLWRSAVEDAMKAGVLRMGDPVSTGDALWGLLHGVVSIAILMPNFSRERVHDMIEAAIEMLSTGLHKA
jgi:AcrR family transcriptional regulator